MQDNEWTESNSGNNEPRDTKLDQGINMSHSNTSVAPSSQFLTEYSQMDEPSQSVSAVHPQMSSAATNVVTSQEAQASTHTEEATTQAVRPGVFVLQWLTYTFWLWAIVTLSLLLTVVVGFFLKSSLDEIGRDIGGVIVYPLAAVVVLIVCAFFTDVLYRREEPQVKTNASALLMVVHAVLCAISAVGSFIIGVFSAVTLLLGEGSSSDSLVSLIVALIITILFSITLVRFIAPDRIKGGILLHGGFIGMVAVAAIILSIVGPISRAHMTKVDRQIETGLPIISESIAEYAEKNNSLPVDLKSLTFSDNFGNDDKTAEQLVTNNRVTYKPEGPAELGGTDDMFDAPNSYSNDQQSLRYQLCVTYASEKKSDYEGFGSSLSDDGYSYSLNIYSHPAGEVCYKLKTSPYSSVFKSDSFNFEDDESEDTLKL